MYSQFTIDYCLEFEVTEPAPNAEDLLDRRHVLTIKPLVASSVLPCSFGSLHPAILADLYDALIILATPTADDG